MNLSLEFTIYITFWGKYYRLNVRKQWTLADCTFCCWASRLGFYGCCYSCWLTHPGWGWNWKKMKRVKICDKNEMCLKQRVTVITLPWFSGPGSTAVTLIKHASIWPLLLTMIYITHLLTYSIWNLHLNAIGKCILMPLFLLFSHLSYICMLRISFLLRLRLSA